MKRVVLTPPWLAMANAELPSTWADAAQTALGNSLWMLPLVAIERLVAGEIGQAGGLGVVWLFAIVVAVKLHVLQDIISSRERQQQLLTWALIICGAVIVGAGLYRLGAQRAASLEPQENAVPAPIIPIPAPLVVQAAPDPLPKPKHIYPNKPDAKEALEGLHDVLVKRVQPAIAIFPQINVMTLQRNMQQAISNRFNLALRPPDQALAPNPKEVKTAAIKSFLENQLSALTDENTKLGDATNAIYGIRAKQKAITMGSTDEFFTLAYPPQTFAEAQGNLVMALRYFLKQDALDTDIVDVMKENYACFEAERTKFSTQITDAVHRIADEISEIEGK